MSDHDGDDDDFDDDFDDDLDIVYGYPSPGKAAGGWYLIFLEPWLECLGENFCLEFYCSGPISFSEGGSDLAIC